MVELILSKYTVILIMGVTPPDDKAPIRCTHYAEWGTGALEELTSTNHGAK